MRKCLLEIGGSEGSRTLATTRSDVVASMMQTAESHRLGILSEYYSGELFKKIAFAKSGAKQTAIMLDIGRRIIKMCRCAFGPQGNRELIVLQESQVRLVEDREVNFRVPPAQQMEFFLQSS